MNSASKISKDDRKASLGNNCMGVGAEFSKTFKRFSQKRHCSVSSCYKLVRHMLFCVGKEGFFDNLLSQNIFLRKIIPLELIITKSRAYSFASSGCTIFSLSQRLH